MSESLKNYKKRKCEGVFLLLLISDHDSSETSVDHDGDQLHAWNEWIHNGEERKKKTFISEFPQ